MFYPSPLILTSAKIITVSRRPPNLSVFIPFDRANIVASQDSVKRNSSKKYSIGRFSAWLVSLHGLNCCILTYPTRLKDSPIKLLEKIGDTMLKLSN